MKRKEVYAGIFWVVEGQLIYDQIRVEVDENSEYTTYPKSHFEMWDELKEDYAGDFCKYPRGRIVYENFYEKYIIYADKCITDDQIFTLKEDFEQFDGHTVLTIMDEHYRCDECLNDFKIEERALLERVKEKWPQAVDVVEEVLEEKALVKIENIVITKSIKCLAYIDTDKKKLGISDKFIFLPDSELLYLLLHEAVHIMPSCYNKCHGKEFNLAFDKVNECMGYKLMSYDKLLALHNQAVRVKSLSLLPKHLSWIRDHINTHIINNKDDIKHMFMDYSTLYYCEKCNYIQHFCKRYNKDFKPKCQIHKTPLKVARKKDYLKKQHKEDLPEIKYKFINDNLYNDTGEIFIRYNISKKYKNEIEIPEGVKEIAPGAFIRGQSLYSIILPDSLEKIGARAFMFLLKLIHILIPQRVNHIGCGAFFYCGNLESIILSKGVKIIEEGAFASCFRLTIYAENETKPDEWNISERPLLLGCTLSEDKSYVIACKKEDKYIDNPKQRIINNPYRKGYTFEGWCNVQDFNGELYLSLKDAPNGRLYAKWVKEISKYKYIKSIL